MEELTVFQLNSKSSNLDSKSLLEEVESTKNYKGIQLSWLSSAVDLLFLSYCTM